MTLGSLANNVASTNHTQINVNTLLLNFQTICITLNIYTIMTLSGSEVVSIPSLLIEEGVCDEQSDIPCIEDPSVMDYFEDDLYESISSGNCKKVMEYVIKGLDVNHAFRSTSRLDRIGKTLLEVAVQAAQTELVKVLVKCGSNANLTYIVEVNKYAYRLKPYTKMNRLKLTCMYPCIVKGSTETIKLLVQGGFDVNVHDERGCTALWHAVDLDNYDMIKAMIVAKGCDVNICDMAMLRPLHIAAMHGNTRLSSLLIRHGAEVDALQLRGSTPLILSCRAGCYKTSRLLILNGANTNQVGYNGHTALSTALQWCQERALPELLIGAGARVDIDLVNKCKGENLIFMDLFPDFINYLMDAFNEIQPMKLLCCLVIRTCLMKSDSKVRLINKVESLPLPKIIKDYVLLDHL